MIDDLLSACKTWAEEFQQQRPDSSCRWEVRQRRGFVSILLSGDCSEDLAREFNQILLDDKGLRSEVVPPPLSLNGPWAIVVLKD